MSRQRLIFRGLQLDDRQIIPHHKLKDNINNKIVLVFLNETRHFTAILRRVMTGYRLYTVFSEITISIYSADLLYSYN